MEQQLKQLEQEALAKIAEAADLKALNDVRVAYLGKKGPITDLLKGTVRVCPILIGYRRS